MSKIECKSCGAALPLISPDRTVKCEYCGLEQSVPDTEVRTENLFEKANNQRRFQQFDEAMETYRSILKIQPNSSEAFWGLCQCRYGVEYVTDPSDGEVKPTCNRMHREMITEDVDYKEALANAGYFVQDYYRKIAEYLAGVQRTFFQLEKNARPYDIFICYKETNERGGRTRDSIHAEVIYEELVKEGYRVFFSRRTLQDVSGEQYEGHIYRALSSARVMLLLASKAEYVESVWMKNEWSRYEYQMQQAPEKKLMLLYRDFDPSVLPERLAKLQGLDMKRWDFQTILRERLKDIFSLKVQPQQEEGKENDDEFSELLKKAEDALKKKRYREAEELFEKARDYDPEDSKLLWGICRARGRGRCMPYTEQKDVLSMEFILAFRYATEEEKASYEEELRKRGKADWEKCEQLLAQQQKKSGSHGISGNRSPAAKLTISEEQSVPEAELYSGSMVHAENDCEDALQKKHALFEQKRKQLEIRRDKISLKNTVIYLAVLAVYFCIRIWVVPKLIANDFIGMAVHGAALFFLLLVWWCTYNDSFLVNIRPLAGVRFFQSLLGFLPVIIMAAAYVYLIVLNNRRCFTLLSCLFALITVMNAVINFITWILFCFEYKKICIGLSRTKN